MYLVLDWTGAAAGVFGCPFQALKHDLQGVPEVTIQLQGPIKCARMKLEICIMFHIKAKVVDFFVLQS